MQKRYMKMKVGWISLDSYEKDFPPMLLQRLAKNVDVNNEKKIEDDEEER